MVSLAMMGLSNVIRSRGPAGIIVDPTETGKQSVSGDDGQVFSLSKQRLAGRCGEARGCVNVLSFEHR
jgi:hypothetical protein